MTLEGKEKVVLVLKYIGEDFCSQSVYQDQFDHLWKDVGSEDSEQPCLYSAINNEFEGEPYTPINQEFIIQPTENRISEEKKFQYQMLGRLISDCEYYLGYGYRDPDKLWAHDEKEQIEKIKKIWLSFSELEKPEWLTWEQIIAYEKEMCK